MAMKSRSFPGQILLKKRRSGVRKSKVTIDKFVDYLHPLVEFPPATKANRDNGVIFQLKQEPVAILASYKARYKHKRDRLGRHSVLACLSSKAFKRLFYDDCCCTSCKSIIYLFDELFPTVFQRIESYINKFESGEHANLLLNFLTDIKSRQASLKAFLSVEGGMNTHIDTTSKCARHSTIFAFSSQTDPAASSDPPIIHNLHNQLPLHDTLCEICFKGIKSLDYCKCRGRNRKGSCYKFAHTKCASSKNFMKRSCCGLWRCGRCIRKNELKNFPDQCHSCSLQLYQLHDLQHIVDAALNIPPTETSYLSTLMAQLSDEILAAEKHIVEARMYQMYLSKNSNQFKDEYTAKVIRDYSSKLHTKSKYNETANAGRSIANEVFVFTMQTPSLLVREMYPTFDFGSMPEMNLLDDISMPILEIVIEVLCDDTSYKNGQPIASATLAYERFFEKFPWISNIQQQLDCMNYYRGVEPIIAAVDFNIAHSNEKIISHSLFSCPGHGKDAADRRTQLTKKRLCHDARLLDVDVGTALACAEYCTISQQGTSSPSDYIVMEFIPTQYKQASSKHSSKSASSLVILEEEPVIGSSTSTTLDSTVNGNIDSTTTKQDLNWLLCCSKQCQLWRLVDEASFSILKNKPRFHCSNIKLICGVSTNDELEEIKAQENFIAHMNTQAAPGANSAIPVVTPLNKRKRVCIDIADKVKKHFSDIQICGIMSVHRIEINQDNSIDVFENPIVGNGVHFTLEEVMKLRYEGQSVMPIASHMVVPTGKQESYAHQKHTANTRAVYATEVKSKKAKYARRKSDYQEEKLNLLHETAEKYAFNSDCFALPLHHSIPQNEQNAELNDFTEDQIKINEEILQCKKLKCSLLTTRIVSRLERRLSTSKVLQTVDGKIEAFDGTFHIDLSLEEYKRLQIDNDDTVLEILKSEENIIENIDLRVHVGDTLIFCSEGMNEDDETIIECDFQRAFPDRQLRRQGWARSPAVGGVRSVVRPARYSVAVNAFLLKLYNQPGKRLKGLDMHRLMKNELQFADPSEMKTPAQIDGWIGKVSRLKKNKGLEEWEAEVLANADVVDIVDDIFDE